MKRQSKNVLIMIKKVPNVEQKNKNCAKVSAAPAIALNIDDYKMLEKVSQE